MCFNRLSDVWKIEIRGRGLEPQKCSFFNTLSISIGFMKELVAIVLQKITFRKDFTSTLNLSPFNTESLFLQH